MIHDTLRLGIIFAEAFSQRLFRKWIIRIIRMNLAQLLIGRENDDVVNFELGAVWKQLAGSMMMIIWEAI